MSPVDIKYLRKVTSIELTLHTQFQFFCFCDNSHYPPDCAMIMYESRNISTCQDHIISTLSSQLWSFSYAMWQSCDLIISWMDFSYHIRTPRVTKRIGYLNDSHGCGGLSHVICQYGCQTHNTN